MELMRRCAKFQNPGLKNSQLLKVMTYIIAKMIIMKRSNIMITLLHKKISKPNYTKDQEPIKTKVIITLKCPKSRGRAPQK